MRELTQEAKETRRNCNTHALAILVKSSKATPSHLHVVGFRQGCQPDDEAGAAAPLEEDAARAACFARGTGWRTQRLSKGTAVTSPDCGGGASPPVAVAAVKRHAQYEWQGAQLRL